jgi:hypothetical protein
LNARKGEGTQGKKKQDKLKEEKTRAGKKKYFVSQLGFSGVHQRCLRAPQMKPRN